MPKNRKNAIFSKKMCVVSPNFVHKVACTNLFYHNLIKINNLDQILKLKLISEQIIYSKSPKTDKITLLVNVCFEPKFWP